jgi:hypothetical protein
MDLLSRDLMDNIRDAILAFGQRTKSELFEAWTAEAARNPQARFHWHS